MGIGLDLANAVTLQLDCARTLAILPRTARAEEFLDRTEINPQPEALRP